METRTVTLIIYHFYHLKLILDQWADITQRFCTAAEAEIYFDNLKNGGNYLKPNRNCNSSHWVTGCEPGWACSTNNEEPVDPRDSRYIPERGFNCDACCEGFFCPYGITCMIRKS